MIEGEIMIVLMSLCGISLLVNVALFHEVRRQSRALKSIREAEKRVAGYFQRQIDQNSSVS